ncbi:unnamed protein product [Mytilus coruscus]|uniref:Uncharacterized protein n=1 Tax=Mytilus coruscus TaxID=42192 RepID=A0A6J8ENF6_MYTCO|nr:unnamed protein product [Mytilus coruscus]
MNKLILHLNFGHDGEPGVVTIAPQAKVHLALKRNEFLLDVVNNYRQMQNENDIIEIEIILSEYNRNFTLGFLLKHLVNDNSEVKICREGKTALLIPLIEKFQLETDFVKLLLPRKISAKNAVAIHSLYIKPMYRSVINEFYLLNLNGVNSQGHISADDFMRLLHELKTRHAHYLVHILPVCICLRCTEYRHERLNQLSECTYATPYHGPITNSPFRHLPVEQQQLTGGRPG